MSKRFVDVVMTDLGVKVLVQDTSTGQYEWQDPRQGW